MPKKALHLCCKAGCGTLTRNKYCDKHTYEKNRYNRERTDRQYTDFYKTKEWLTVRGIALARDRYQCVMCKRKGIITMATMVHHIIPVKKDWNKRLELSNLMSLCECCHNGIDHNEAPTNQNL